MLKFISKYCRFLKYFNIGYYDRPESVPVVSVRGMIYMQIAIFLYIIFVSLCLGGTDTL